MDKFVRSADDVTIHYLISGNKPTALVFVHGWLGNAEWWNSQRAFFEDQFTIVQVDLPGRGQSGHNREHWTAEAYAADIKAVVDDIPAEEVILVGHSMSGPYTLLASLNTPKVKMVVLVDTVKDLDHVMDIQQANEIMFSAYRKDFRFAVEKILPQYLYAKGTPEPVQKQLQQEFLANTAEFAISSLEPLYKLDLRHIASQVRVPVRAINSDYTPTNADSIRKLISDYAFTTLQGTGHYPMLEDPKAFNEVLAKTIA